MRRSLLLWTVVLMVVALCQRETFAESPDELIQQALEQEVDGTPARRSELLQRVLAIEASNSAAHWQSGYVRDNDEWVGFRHARQRTDVMKLSEEYRALRSKTPDTFAGHVKLADWCRSHRLAERERAHVTAALAKPGKSNDAVLRARLGFVLVDGRWELRSDLLAAKDESRDWRRAFQRWRPKLQRIAEGLSRPRTRKSSAAQLKAIDDPSALPAMEAVFSHRDVGSVLLLLKAYDGMPSHQAAVALARQAVGSPWDAVREAAAEKLKSRPPEAFVPHVIGALHTPIASKVELYVGTEGVRLSQAFFREHRDFKELALIDSQLQAVPYGVPFFSQQSLREIARGDRSNQRFGGRLDQAERALRASRRRVDAAIIGAELQIRAAESKVEAENETTQRQNERICRMLSMATGIELGADAKGWWQWWLDYNELYEDEEKPCRYYCRKSKETVPMPYLMPSSCLAAGTLVWTDRGAVPVESVTVGDLALSKHPETGELAWKPVLRTTVRPATQLWKVATRDGEFHATGGHTFWISGRGWQKIRDVKPGMRFHGAEGPMTLAAEIEKGREEPTYNLVVADFHTYFVSESMLLSHDPTFAEPTDVLVPGLAAK